MGGSRADQLGALGRNATIRGGSGNDLIHGGQGHDVIYGGSGNDLIIDPKGTATIRTGPGRNEVKVAGHRGRDQVLCAPGSVDRIFADRGDYIAPSCREAPRSRVVYHRPPRSAQPARDPDGCTNNPHVDCTFLNIDFFAPRLVRPDDYVIGAQVGSVTNWTFSPQPWHMWLHCTSDKSQG